MLERHSGHSVILIFTASKNAEYMDLNTTSNVGGYEQMRNVMSDIISYCQKLLNIVRNWRPLKSVSQLYFANWST